MSNDKKDIVSTDIIKYKVGKTNFKDNHLSNNTITNINTDPIISPQSNQKVKMIIITSIILVIVLGIIVTLCALLIQKGKDGESININPIKEELVVKLKRELNEVSRYFDTKKTKTILNINGEDQINEQEITTDVIINIYNIKNTSDNLSSYYEAFFVVIEMKRKNKTAEEFISGIDILQDSLPLDDNITENDSLTIEADDESSLSG